MPRGAPSGKNNKKIGKSPRGPKAREGLWTKVRECGGGIEVRGGPGTVRGGPGTACGGPDTVRGGPSLPGTLNF